jgi:alkylation response protein AidB-like acyl-CoA dehydrogenase
VIARRPFTADNDMVRESCRKWWEQEVVPHHAQWEKDGQVSRELWESAGANGFLAMTTPEAYGGYGGSILDVRAVSCSHAMHPYMAHACIPLRLFSLGA